MQTPPRKGHALGDRVSHLRLWLTVVVSLAVDLASKSVAWRLLGEPVPSDGAAYVMIPQWLRLATSRNFGIVFGFNFADDLGLGPVLGRWLTILLTVATCALIFYLFSTTQTTQRWVHVACALTLAGALGNLYDRVAFGYVRDFIQFTGHLDLGGRRFDWPYIFNVADVYLVVGVLVLAAAYLFGSASSGEPEAGKERGSQRTR